MVSRADKQTIRYLPFIQSEVRAGFPSPSDDYIESKLDLNEHLIQHPSATYYIRVVGDSMIDYGIFNGDLLIVDRSLEPRTGDIIIVAIENELTCKCLSTIDGQPFLISGNTAFPPISLFGKDVHVWGVVIHNIHSLRGKN